jgi:hypothetical protein
VLCSALARCGERSGPRRMAAGLPICNAMAGNLPQIAGARFTLALLCLVCSISGTASAQAMPDPVLTPGAALPVSRAEVCQPGYSAAARRVPQHVRREVLAAYRVACDRCGAVYELDHLIPLSLGGSNEAANLWPQPYEPRPGARGKDRIERYLHAQVCSGKMPLAEAQRLIASDWYALWLHIAR